MFLPICLVIPTFQKSDIKATCKKNQGLSSNRRRQVTFEQCWEKFLKYQIKDFFKIKLLKSATTLTVHSKPMKDSLTFKTKKV